MLLLSLVLPYMEVKVCTHWGCGYVICAFYLITSLCGQYVPMANMHRTRNKMAASHVSRFIRMHVFHVVKMANISCSHTNRKRSSFTTKHFQRKSLKLFDLHLPLRRLVSFVARIIAWKVRCWVTDTHTHTQTHRPSTVTLAAHVHRGLIIIHTTRCESLTTDLHSTVSKLFRS